MTKRGMWYFFNSMHRFMSRKYQPEYEKMFADLVIYGRAMMPSPKPDDLDDWKPNRRAKA